MRKMPDTPHVDERFSRSYTTYANHGCRCPDCRADNTRQKREWLQRQSPEKRRELAVKQHSYRRRKAAGL